MKTKIPSEHISKTSLIYQRYKINSPDSEIIFRNWTASRVSYWRKLHINRERHCKCFKDQTTIHLFKQKLKRCCFNYGVTLNKFRLAFKKTFPMKSNYNHWIDFPQGNNQSYCDYYNYFWWNFSEKKIPSLVASKSLLPHGLLSIYESYSLLSRKNWWKWKKCRKTIVSGLSFSIRYCNI